jgi:hypothetical protein
MARALISERIGLRPDSSYNWSAQAGLADGLGDAALAAVAREHARGAAAAAAEDLRPPPPRPGSAPAPGA